MHRLALHNRRAILMRYAAAFAVAAVLASYSAAHAEKRVFILANNPDGYGVDRCLSTGARCGVAVATAYCQAREFVQAASFRKIERQEITGAIAATESEFGEYVAIECLR
jgi:hypothetical protein